MEMSAPTTAMAPQPSTNTNSNSPSEDNSNNNFDPPNYITHHTEAEAEAEEHAASKILNLKFVNATSFVLTAMMVIGVVLFKVRAEGVFGDEFLWMKYQTLLTPPPYVNYLWIPLFLLQGLFLYASTLHKTLQHSPLVGYDSIMASLTTTALKQSIAVHYPAICASTLMMVYSHDYGYIGCAFLSSVLCGVILMNVLKIQSQVLSDNGMDSGGSGNVDESFNSTKYHDFKTRALQYTALLLPFELYGGYVLALVSLYFNTFLNGFNALPTLVFLISANVSLAALTCAGFWMLWKTERKRYGVGVALVWYLLGVAIELHTPTQPIYNEFSDHAILTTQITAAVAALILVTLLSVRVTKTMIKSNVFNCVDALGGGDRSVVSEGEQEISTDYVHA